MGIPFYFREIVQGNKGLLRSQPPGCARLYLDFNSVIHVCSQQVVAAKKPWKDPKTMEHAIFAKIVEYTSSIVEECPPSQLLYLGIDGVAPLAKMVQQRKRRHLSAMQNRLINEFKAKNNLPFTTWDSNCITPGTEFMHRLNVFLRSHYAAHPRSYEVIVSGPDEQGEGEHKIIKYIKELGNKDPFVDVIYGLDADLIMLALTCKKPKVFLMREASQVSSQRHQQQQGFKYLDIDVMRTSVATHVYNQPKEPFMLDYVCLCFLLGNDFLPHCVAYDLKHNGLQILCDMYRTTYETRKDMLILWSDQDNKYVMNLPFLLDLLERLAANEDTQFKQNITEHYDRPPRLPVLHHRTPLDTFMYELNYMPILQRKKVIDPESDPSWKATYYHTYFGMLPSDIKAMDDVCENFIQGLLWNVDYYFNNIFSNAWYYKSNAAPFLGDVVKYIKKMNDTALQQQLDVEPLELVPLEQLMLVLPYESHGLLPKEVREQMQKIDSGVIHLYPSSFQVITLCKTQLWECPPILPPIDVARIKGFLKSSTS